MSTTYRRILASPRPLIVEGIPSSFSITDHGARFHIVCKTCAQRWTIPKGDVSIPDRLLFVSHAYAHHTEG